MLRRLQDSIKVNLIFAEANIHCLAEYIHTGQIDRSFDLFLNSPANILAVESWFGTGVSNETH